MFDFIGGTTSYRAVAEDAYDWDGQSGVPSALTDDMIRQAKEKERDKKKRSKQKKKEDKAAKEDVARREEEAKAAAEALLRESAGECALCRKSLYKSVDSYDVFDKKCCSSACAVLMRRKLMAEAAEKRLKR